LTERIYTQALSKKQRIPFTPLHPESPAFQSGDEWKIKIKSSRKPRLLRRGVTGFTLMIAESNPIERDVIVTPVVNLINRNN